MPKKEVDENKVREWINKHIKMETLGAHLKAGLEATKHVYKEEVPDYSVRLAYIDWISDKGGYVPEKKVGGGTFSMPAPSQAEVDRAFGEERPDEQPDESER